MGVCDSIARRKNAQADGDLAVAGAALALIDVAEMVERLFPRRPRTPKSKVMGRPAYSREAIVRALLLVAHPDVAVPSVGGADPAVAQ